MSYYSVGMGTMPFLRLGHRRVEREQPFIVDWHCLLIGILVFRLRANWPAS